MRNIRILVADDRAMVGNIAGERYSAYLEYENVSLAGVPVSIEFASGIEDAKQKIAANDYDLVLLDVLLELWGDDPRFGKNFKQLLIQADARCAVGLVSAGWDETSIPLVRSILDENPQINVPLMFTLNDIESKAYTAIGTQIISHIKRRRGAHGLEVDENHPIHILHMSDLHFGSRYADEVFTKNFATTLSSLIMRQCEEGLHLVAITGDIGNFGHPSDYQKAIEWLHFFCSKLGIDLPSPRILIVPGNHDFCIPMASAAAVDLKSQNARPIMNKTKNDKSLSNFAMQPFFEFARLVTPIYGIDLPLHQTGWVSTAFAQYGLVFSGLNTAYTCNDSFWPARKFNPEALYRNREALMPLSDKIQRGELLHIALSHHSPISYGEVHEPVDEDVRQIFLENYLNDQHAPYAPKVILHGHQHLRIGKWEHEKRCLIICAPTPSETDGHRAPDSLRGVNLLTLRRQGSIVHELVTDTIYKEQSEWKAGPLLGTRGCRLVPKIEAIK